MELMARSALVQHGDNERTLMPNESLTFGRSERCDICLRPADEGISRWAGSLSCESGTWWLTNESETRPFDVVQFGFEHPLAPGLRVALDGGRIEAVLTGLVYGYCVAMTVQPVAEGRRKPRILTGNQTKDGHDVPISENEHLALVAMFAWRLRPFPWSDDEPTTYKQAGERLGESPVGGAQADREFAQEADGSGHPEPRGPRGAGAPRNLRHRHGHNHARRPTQASSPLRSHLAQEM